MLNETYYSLGSRRSCIRDLFEYGRQRAAQVGQENVYDYSLGNPSIPAPPQVNEAIRQILSETDTLLVHGYTPANGSFDARKAISDDINARFGVKTQPEEFFLTCGAAPALVSVLKALSVPEGEILVIAPYFPEYKVFIEEAGMTCRVVPADETTFQIDLKALEKMVNHNTQAILLNSPNNPSGVVYTRQTLKAVQNVIFEKIMEIGKTIYIISDEPYRELAYDGVEVPYIPGIFADTITCYSWSKSLSIPGERIGYVHVPTYCTESKRLAAAVAGAARASGHVCAPSLWQKVIARCAHLRPDLESYDRNRRLMYDALTEMGYEMPKPEGAFYLFIKAPGGDAEAFSQAAKEQDLLVVPGTDFGCPGYFRICYCVSSDMIRRSLPVFARLMKEFSE